jgi:hypothetical protein
MVWNNFGLFFFGLEGVDDGGSCLPRQTCCNSPFSMKMTYIFFILILLLSRYYSLIGGPASQVCQILELAFDHCGGAHRRDNVSITVI